MEREFELKSEHARQMGRDGEENAGDDVETGENTVVLGTM